MAHSHSLFEDARIVSSGTGVHNHGLIRDDVLECFIIKTNDLLDFVSSK